MKIYQPQQIKKFALIGNSSSGKTTLAEAMLFEAKVIDRRGDVESKSATSDYRPIEHANVNSVFATLLYAEVNDTKINMLDCPGLDDFVGATVSSLNPIDTAVMVINAQNGVEVGTEIHNRYCDKFNKPMVIVLNQLDHEKANVEKCIE